MAPITWKCVVCARTMDAASRTQHAGAKPHQRALARVYSLSTWRCDVCRRTMSGGSIAAHLRTKEHQELATSSPPPPVGAASLANSSATTTGTGTWQCNVCCRSMNLRQRNEHLSGSAHKKIVARMQSRTACVLMSCQPRCLPLSTVASFGSVLTSMPSTTTASVPIAAEWKCIVCLRTMNLKDRDNHLSGARHAAKVAGQNKASSPASTTTPQWQSKAIRKCVACDSKMAMQDKIAYLCGKHHQEMLGGSSHGGGRGGGHHDGEARKGGRRYPGYLPDDNEDDGRYNSYDSDDARDILYDI